MRNLSGFCRECQRRLLAIGAIALFGRHLRVREAVVPQLVQRHLVRGDDELPVARRADLERKILLELGEVCRGDLIEADEVDGRHLDRFAFGDRDGEIHFVLFVVELYVEAGDARIRVSPIGIERLNALQIRIEAGAVEVVLPAPGKDGTLLGRERAFQTSFVNGLGAFERDAVNLDRPFFLASGCKRHGKQRDGPDQGTHGWHSGTIFHATEWAG